MRARGSGGAPCRGTPQWSPVGSSGRRCCDARTRGCLRGTARSSTTSPCRGCSTSRSSAATSPAGTSATRRARPRWPSRVCTRSSRRETSTPTVGRDGPDVFPKAMPRRAGPPAGRRRRPLRRRALRARRRREPLRSPRTRCDADRRRVRAADAVIDYEAAADDAEHVVHPELGTQRRRGDPRAARPRARRDLRRAPRTWSRGPSASTATSACPMESRGVVAIWDGYRDELASASRPRARTGCAAVLARALGVPENRVRVVHEDVGGGFGQKMFMLPDEICRRARRASARPTGEVDRGPPREPHGRSARARRAHAPSRLALDADGHILGADVDHLEDVGAFPSAAPAARSAVVGMLFPGPYRMPKVALPQPRPCTRTRAGACRTGGRG